MYKYIFVLFFVAFIIACTPSPKKENNTTEPTRKVSTENTIIEPEKKKKENEAFEKVERQDSKYNDVEIEEIVSDYFDATLNRDFDFVYNNYLTKCKQYYDIKNCTYENLKKRFEYLWSITENNKYEITDRKITQYPNYYSVIITQNYSYFGKKTNEQKNLIANVEFFELNLDGEIINIYDGKNPK